MTALALLLTACAAGPPRGGLAWVGVHEIVKPADLAGNDGYRADRNVDHARLQAAGLDAADVAAGRLALVSCSPSTDAAWFSYAVLPSGVTPKVGEVMRLHVREDSRNDRLALNPVVGEVVPGLVASLPAYEAIPDWRERGLRDNYRQVPLPDAQRDRYRLVQGSYRIAC